MNLRAAGQGPRVGSRSVAAQMQAKDMTMLDEVDCRRCVRRGRSVSPD
jgi:hypothetical protein